MEQLLSVWQNPNHWRRLRAEYMNAARACRDTLTNEEGYWRYSELDPRVKSAVGIWVGKARSFHNILMGRRAIIQNAVFISSHGISKEPLYLER